MADEYENDGATAEEADLPYAYKLEREEKLKRVAEARERHEEARDADSGDTGEPTDDASRTDDTYGAGESDF